MTLGKSSGHAILRNIQNSYKLAFRFVGVLFLITAAWVGNTAPALAQNFTTNRIEIEGNQRIGDSAILSQAGIVRGQTLTAGQLNAAFQRLQNSGLFESVDISPVGGTLRIKAVSYTHLTLPTICSV